MHTCTHTHTHMYPGACILVNIENGVSLPPPLFRSLSTEWFVGLEHEPETLEPNPNP